MIPFLKGKHVYLRALVPEDARGAYVDWLNDAEVCAANGHHLYPYTAEQALAFIERSRNAQDELTLAIVRSEDDRHIGNLTLKRIDKVARSAELAILLGDKESWGKGYSKEACRLLCDHAFFTLNLNRVYCGTYETNAAMQKLAGYLGMKAEGRRRQAAFKDGKHVDVLEFGVLRQEYVEIFGASGENNEKRLRDRSQDGIQPASR